MSETTELWTRKIAVYHESPLWDLYKRWFLLPQADLEALFVVEYTITGDWINEADVEHHADEVRAIHPDCVLVY